MDVFIHYGMAAGIQAIKDAGLEAHPANAERIGVSISVRASAVCR
jgi:3-oxoacyl-[acyl-carrier-protein] synthase II